MNWFRCGKRLGPLFFGAKSATKLCSQDEDQGTDPTLMSYKPCQIKLAGNYLSI